MIRSSLRTALAAALTLGAATGAQAQTTVNFDSFIGMPNVGTLVPIASRLSTELLSSGVRFSSLSDYVAVVLLGTGHATSGTLGIGGTSASGALNYSAPVRMTFWDPANSAVQGVTSFVQTRGDLRPIQGTITMRVFDPFGALLATVSAPDAGGTTLSYNGANIHSVEFTSTSATVAFDDFQFGDVSAVPNEVVPEPSAIALFSGGVLLLGAIARRRRGGKQLGLGDELDAERRHRTGLEPVKALGQGRGRDGHGLGAGGEVFQRIDTGHVDAVVAQQLQQAFAPAIALGQHQNTVLGVARMGF
jgi:hypothetical protein